MKNNEVWKSVKGLESLYEVSNLGNVRKCNGEILEIKHVMGYAYVNLIGYNKMSYVHRIVAEAFIDNPMGLPVVNHINEIKDDNRVENLEWCTQKHNCNHNDKGKRIAESGKDGNRNKYGCKTIYSVDKNGNKVFYLSTYDASRKTGIGKQNIYNCLKGLYKTAGGLKWFYSDSNIVTFGLF